MSSASVPLVVLSCRQDDAEIINRAMRDAGHAAHCHWLASLDQLAETVHIADAQMIWLFCDSFADDVRTVAQLRDSIQRTLPLIAVASDVNETSVARAMLAGAHDLISIKHPQRVARVAERELRSYRLERALNTSLHSARQYQEQLRTFMDGSDDAIAHVTEGIVIDTNPIWAELFERSHDDMLGPVMDLFDAGSHAAIKGALVASQRGQWSDEPLRLIALTGTGEKFALDIELEAALFDGEPAVKLSIRRDQVAEEEPEEVVSRAVSADPSTGLYHRCYFIQSIEERLRAGSGSGTRALAYIRPDKFAEVADSVGPIASEELLVQFAGILAEAAHGHDICGRFGGTEFAIWIERGTLRDVEAWAEGVVSAVSEAMFECTNKTLSLTCTIGLADVGPNAGSIEELFRGAQRASQRGRQRGGNQAVLEETSDESTRVQRFDEMWVSQIRNALIENRFQLARLSIASLHGEQRALFDTVVKMIDTQGDDISASTFLPVAERNGLMRAIDRWVVDAALKAASETGVDSMFVRLSSESIVDPEYLPWLWRCVQAAGVQTSRLCFQVAEQTLNQHLKETIQLSQHLREKGFGFAISHFGVGRDPARLLRQVAADYVKIDGSLMQQLGKSESCQNKVQGLINEASAVGIGTIAERVEDANTMAVLFQLGVGYVQGHYVHEPEVVLEDVV
jgi:diguanylate cyclase (GGDEF)-like protein